MWEGKPQDLVERCIQTWKAFADDWTINVLTSSSAAELLSPNTLPPNFKNFTILVQSDIIRLEIVAYFGGVWLDASVALTQPLDDWIQPAEDGNTLVGFELDFAGLARRSVSPSNATWYDHFHPNGSLITRPWDGGDQNARYFESWGFAAAANSSVIVNWRDEMRKASFRSDGIDGYCRELATSQESDLYLHPDFKKWLPYLTIHLTLARVRYIDPTLPVKVWRAESSAFLHMDYALDWALVKLMGPTNFALDGTGGAIFALARSQSDAPPPPQVGPFVKFRSLDRTAYEALVLYQAYHKDSPLAQILSLPEPPRLWPVAIARYAAAFESRFGPTTDPFLLFLFSLLHGLCRLLLTVTTHPLLCFGLAGSVFALALKFEGFDRSLKKEW